MTSLTDDLVDCPHGFVWMTVSRQDLPAVLAGGACVRAVRPRRFNTSPWRWCRFQLTKVRKDGSVPWLRPDGKTQVTVEYKKEGGAMIPLRVHTVLISTQHNEDVTNDQIHKVLPSQPHPKGASGLFGGRQILTSEGHVQERVLLDGKLGM